MHFIGKELTLKEMPDLYFGNPAVKVGNSYKIIDVEGSNFWLLDDNNELCSFSKYRFDLSNKK